MIRRTSTAPRVLLLAVVVTASGAPAATASAAARPPIKDCGDVLTLDQDSFFLGAVTAQGASCKSARLVARRVAASLRCQTRGSCRVRKYTCLLAKAGKELTLVRCDKRRQTAFIRFEFGS